MINDAGKHEVKDSGLNARKLKGFAMKALAEQIGDSTASRSMAGWSACAA